MVAARGLKPLVFCLLAVPLALLGFDVWRELQVPGSGFGPDPGEEVVHHLGSWGLRVLLLTLAVSPASRVLRKPRLIRFRRMAGLWAFAYLVLHFTAYLGLLAGFEFATITEDIVKRPYITVGFLALVLLVPLAATSTRGWQRRLGRRLADAASSGLSGGHRRLDASVVAVQGRLHGSLRLWTGAGTAVRGANSVWDSATKGRSAPQKRESCRLGALHVRRRARFPRPARLVRSRSSIRR